MSKKLYEENGIAAIANAIRAKNGSNSTYTVAQMPSAISNIKTDPILQEKTANDNGIILPDSGYDGLSKVTVAVPKGSTPILQEKTANDNGIILPDSGYDGLSKVTVDVQGGGSIISSQKIPNAYYEPYLATGEWLKHYNIGGIAGTNTTIYGVEFIIKNNCILYAVAGVCLNDNSGVIRIGTLSEILEVSDTCFFEANKLTTVQLNNPIICYAGEHYIIQLVMDTSPGKIGYSNSESIVTYDTDIASLVRARYGNFPGNTEATRPVLSFLYETIKPEIKTQ